MAHEQPQTHDNPPEQGADTLSRRGMLGAGALAAAGILAGGNSALAQPGNWRPMTAKDPRDWLLTEEELGWDERAGEYRLPDLPYGYADLEDVIDEETMRIHHTKHHAGYVRGLNASLTALRAIRQGSGDEGLIQHWSRQLSFHSAGHFNHALFWQNMMPKDDARSEPRGPLAEAIDESFGSFDRFKTHFASAAKKVEGSGWGWLVYMPVAKRLMVLQGESQQKLVTPGVVPLLGIDVWEHAYYLKYKNERGRYVDSWFGVVNWGRVERSYEMMSEVF